MSKVSIIIPVYNVEKYLDKCLKSVLNQTYKNIEIIVINDGSTDNSLKICKKYKDKRIVLIDKENGGVSSARNKGLELASGKYITFREVPTYGELYLQPFTGRCISRLTYGFGYKLPKFKSQGKNRKIRD